MAKIVVAIDSFKNCLTSKEANQAAAEGIRIACPDAEILQVPVSDGGEGFITAFQAAIGGELEELTVSDPLMRPVRARYLLKGHEAVIEMAEASGLMLLSEEERNPMIATSYGTGQLVADAIKKGAIHIIVGLGGSATSDAGIGMLKALMDAFSPIRFKCGEVRCWDNIAIPDAVRFTIATDVDNPLCGPRGAAYVFSPQKGATPDMVVQLERRAEKFAELSARHFGYDRQDMPGAGAAGGLGYAFMQYMDADRTSGIRLLLDTIRFRETANGADLIITGEGSADRQTLMGKLPMGILQQAGRTPVCLIAGRVADREQLLKAGFSRVACINPEGIALETALRKDVAMRNISRTAMEIVRRALVRQS